MSKILIVDDDPQMSRLLRILFEMEGFEVVVAQRYQDILPTIQQARPDAVLMDVRVQGRETLDLVRQMRQERALTDIPVVHAGGHHHRDGLPEAMPGSGSQLFPDEAVCPGRGGADHRHAAEAGRIIHPVTVQ